MIKIFTNKNKELRSGFKLALFTIIYVILSSTLGPVFLTIVHGLASENNLIQGEDLERRIEKYLYSTDVGVFSLQLIGFVAMLLTVIILLRGLEGKQFKDIGFISIKNDVKGLIWGLLLGAGTMTIIFIFLLASGNIQLKESLLKPNLTASTLWGIALYVIVALNEEIMCRGYIQTTLNQMGRPWLSAVITSALFSVLHLGNPNVKILGLLNIFIIGLVFSYMYIRTKSLWMPIGYHFTWNYFQGNVFGFPVSGTTQSKGIYNIGTVNENILTGGSFGPEAGIVATVVIIIGAVIVWRVTKYKNFTT